MSEIPEYAISSISGGARPERHKGGGYYLKHEADPYIAGLEAEVEKLTKVLKPGMIKFTIFFGDGEEPFIHDYHGNVCVLDELEKEFLTEDDLNEGPGDYEFTVYHEPAQTGEFGMVEIPEHWEVDKYLFTPIPPVEDK